MRFVIFLSFSTPKLDWHQGTWTQRTSPTPQLFFEYLMSITRNLCINFNIFRCNTLTVNSLNFPPSLDGCIHYPTKMEMEVYQDTFLMGINSSATLRRTLMRESKQWDSWCLETDEREEILFPTPWEYSVQSIDEGIYFMRGLGLWVGIWRIKGKEIIIEMWSLSQEEVWTCHQRQDAKSGVCLIVHPSLWDA